MTRLSLPPGTAEVAQAGNVRAGFWVGFRRNGDEDAYPWAVWLGFVRVSGEAPSERDALLCIEHVMEYPPR